MEVTYLRLDPVQHWADTVTIYLVGTDEPTGVTHK